MGGYTRSGARRRALPALAVAAVLVAAPACGGGGDDDGSVVTTTTAAEGGEATPTSEAEEDAGDPAEAYDAALRTLEEEYNAAAQERDDAAQGNDLEGGVEASAAMAEVVSAFSDAIAEIEFPEDVREDSDELESQTQEMLGALEDFEDVEDVDGYNAALEAELDLRDAWFESLNAVAEGLEVDIIEFLGSQADASGSTGGEGSGGESGSEGEEGAAAGDTFEKEFPSGAVLTGEVPEGFEFTGQALSTEDDVFIDMSNLTVDSAQEVIDNQVETYGAEVVTGPDEVEVAGDTGELYEYRGGLSPDDYSIEIFFTVDGQLYSLNLHGEDGVMDAYVTDFLDFAKTVSVS